MRGAGVGADAGAASVRGRADAGGAASVRARDGVEGAEGRGGAVRAGAADGRLPSGTML
jgi:hypothetical protein